MEFLDFGTIFFLVAAVVIFYQLRSVLGRRTGNERPPFDARTGKRTGSDTSAEDNVVTLPRRKGATAEDKAAFYAAIDEAVKPGSKANTGLRAIKDVEANFDPKTFLDGASMAYEMIVMSYADGDRKTLRNLLSREVYDGFDSAITEREKRGEKVQSSFVGIDKSEIISAELKGTEAHITVRIVSEMISATIDKAGEVIDGDPETVAEGTDVWTFARDLRSRDPNWKLVATEEE